MRRRLDSAVVSELEAVDAALAGTRPDADVAAIAAAARADAIPMSPAFAARLQEAVRAGFPAAAAPAGSRRRRRRPRALAAAGAIAAALAAIVVAASALHGGGAPATEHVASGAASSAGTAVQGVPVPAPALAEAGTRRVQRGAELTIATPVDRLQDTADGVAAIADRLGGFVARSDASVTGNGGQATFDLRIPAGRLDDALAAISRLGHVRSRSQQSLDVTGAYDSARARLRDAQAERAALLRALAGATTQPQIDSLQARLRIVRGQIAAAGRALDSARRASAQAQVSVTVLGVARAGAAAAHPGHRWTPGRALHDAVGVLSALLGVLIVALAAALPIAALAAGAVFAGRALRRRRREQALESSSPAV
jgi:hypothetical protein